MKKIIITLALTLFLIACQSQQPGYVEQFNPYKGTDSLELKFIQGFPPEEVYEETSFRTVLELRNKGASDIIDGMIALSYESDYLIAEDIKQDISLKGKSKTDTEGGFKTKTFKLTSKTIDPQSEEHKTTITATACYEYSTQFSTDVCIDTDIYSLSKENKPCEVKDQTFSGQGAPVTITRVEPTMLAHEDEDMIKPQFIITIRNNGDGQIFDRWKIDAMCSAEPILSTDWNKINIDRVYLSSSQNLNCRPLVQGTVTLKEKEDIIQCTLEQGISTDKGIYASPLTIELSYGYTESKSKTITLKKALT